MRQHRRVVTAAGLAVLVALLGVGGTLATAPRAHAAAQANQMWFGSYWNYLGYPSGGGSYIGHIHTFQASDKCLDVPGWAFYDYNGWNPSVSEKDPSGTQVQLWTCMPFDLSHDFDRNQNWNQHDNGDGSWSYYVTGNAGYNQTPFYWQFTGSSTNYCLDSLGGHHYNGSPVMVFPCNGGASQRWTIGWEGQLQSVDSPGYCLDDTNWGTYDGAQIQLWQCAY